MSFKYIASSIALGLIASAPGMAHAAAGLVQCDPSVIGSCNLCSLLKTVDGLIKWVMGLSFTGLTIIVIIAAFKMINSKGNPSAMKSAWDGILKGIVGIVIMFAAWTMVSTFVRFFAKADSPLRFWNQIQCAADECSVGQTKCVGPSQGGPGGPSCQGYVMSCGLNQQTGHYIWIGGFCCPGGCSGNICAAECTAGTNECLSDAACSSGFRTRTCEANGVSGGTWREGACCAAGQSCQNGLCGGVSNAGSCTDGPDTYLNGSSVCGEVKRNGPECRWVKQTCTNGQWTNRSCCTTSSCDTAHCIVQ